MPDGVGVVFQEDASFPWLTVAANIAFGLRQTGTDPAEVKRRVEYALGFMGLRDFRDATRPNCPAACASACASPAPWCCSRA